MVFDIKIEVMKLGWVTWIQVSDEFMFRNVNFRGLLYVYVEPG